MTIASLERQLKLKSNQLRAASFKSNIRAFMSGFFSTVDTREFNSFPQQTRLELSLIWQEEYRLKQLLEARKTAIAEYKKYRAGASTYKAAKEAVLHYKYLCAVKIEVYPQIRVTVDEKKMSKLSAYLQKTR